MPHGFVPVTVIVAGWPATTGLGEIEIPVTVDGGGVPTGIPTDDETVRGQHCPIRSLLH